MPVSPPTLASRAVTCRPSVSATAWMRCTSSGLSSSWQRFPNFSRVGRKPFSSTRRPRSDRTALNFISELHFRTLPPPPPPSAAAPRREWAARRLLLLAF